MSGAAPTPGRAGCLLALLQTSASMARPCRYRGRKVQRLRAARFCLDQTIEALLALREAGDPIVEGLRVGVLDFAGASLLPGDSGALLPPLEELAGLAGAQRRRSEVRRWVMALKPSEEGPPLEQALAEASRLLVSWMAASPDGRPPLLLICSDGAGEGPEAERLRRSLSLLATTWGPLRTAEARFGSEEEVCPGAALTINRPFFPMVEGLMRQWGERGRVSAPSDLPALTRPGSPGLCEMRLLTTPKRGNSEEECEDGALCRPEEGLAAVCDGAGEGIFTRRWVQRLLDSYAVERPDVTDRTAFLDWLQRCRQEWFGEIGFDGLRGYQQNKVLDTGAGGTFLAWQLGEAGPDGSFAWRAWAVGDACLFWVRRDVLWATFPMAHWRHFGLTPCLLRSRRDVPVPAPVFAAGRCLPGDVFFLATDAVAQELLRCVAEGQGPSWDELLTLSEEGWRERIERLRDAGRITNDDSTLLSVRV